MRKWSPLVVIVFVLAAAATVLAFQNYKTTAVAAQQVAVNEVAPQPAPEDGSYSGCGGSAGCGSGGCGGTLSGCGGEPVDPAQNQQRIEDIKSYLYSYFSKELNDTQISVNVEDFGCHQEAYLLKDGQVIKRFSVSGNSISEIG